MDSEKEWSIQQSPAKAHETNPVGRIQGIQSVGGRKAARQAEFCIDNGDFSMIAYKKPTKMTFSFHSTALHWRLTSSKHRTS